MTNDCGWQGRFEIYVNGKLDAVITNRIMDAILNEMADVLKGTAPDLSIKYVALGTSNTALTDTQTGLVTEIFRTAPVSNPTRTATGEITTEFTILDTEAVAQIEEIGIFVGSSATSSANSGKLLSRILWSKNKTNSEELTIRRVDKIVRA